MFSLARLGRKRSWAETLEPTTDRNLGFAVEPLSELSELVRRDFAGADAIEKMVKQCRRKIAPPDLSHRPCRRKNRGRFLRGRGMLPPGQSR